MVLFGLVVLVLGVLLLLAGIFSTDYQTEGSGGSASTTAEILGIDVTLEVLFLLGAVAAVLILTGLWVMKTGAKMGWKHRKEQKRLEELSEKLDRAEADRRRDEDEELDGR